MARVVVQDAVRANLLLQGHQARRRSVVTRQQSRQRRLKAIRLQFRYRQVRRDVVGRIYAMDESGTGQSVDRLGVVLVADDDPGLRESLKEILQVGGHRVLVARDGAETLQLLGEHEVDVLVLDMNMPVHDGWAVLRQLDDTARPAVIINSGEDFSARDMREFFDVRPFGMLRKPTPPPYVLTVVDSAIVHLRMSADERDRVADQRDRVADERDRVADRRDRVADERDRAADERDVVTEARDVVVDERGRVADARDLMADERDRVADRRDVASDERDRMADERDRMADERDRVADHRGDVADERDDASGPRDAAATEPGGGSTDVTSTSAREQLLARARAAVNRSTALAQQTESALSEAHALRDRPRT